MTFKHHAEVAGWDAAETDRLLEWYETTRAKRRCTEPAMRHGVVAAAVSIAIRGVEH